MRLNCCSHKTLSIKIAYIKIAYIINSIFNLIGKYWTPIEIKTVCGFLLMMLYDGMEFPFTENGNIDWYKLPWETFHYCALNTYWDFAELAPMHSI